jgi:hypothetical protein
VRRARSVHTPTQTLLLESARRKDECAVIEKRLGGGRRVYFTVASAHAPGAASSIDAALLAAFEGGARIDAIRASSALDDLALMQAIGRLVERGQLVASHTAPNPSPHKPTEVPAARSGLWRGAPPLGARRLPRRSSASVLAGVAGFAISLLSIVWLLRIPAEPDVPTTTVIAPLEAAGDDEPEPTETAPAPVAPSAPEAPPSETGVRDATYPVQAVVEPPHAVLWLDGKWIATGELSIVLPRDGRTHELRITAPHHHAQTILFRDAPPPRAIRLEPIASDGP